MTTKTIDAHKVIVCARCATLKSIIEEKGENVSDEGRNVTKVRMEGIGYFVFLSLLKYLYTDNLIAVSYHVPKLKVIADDYGLDRLSKLCKRYAGTLNKDEGSLTVTFRKTDLLESVTASSWASDMKKMVNSPDYSDLKLKLQDGTDFFAHKMILSSRTDYFKTIFEGICLFTKIYQILSSLIVF